MSVVKLTTEALPSFFTKKSGVVSRCKIKGFFTPLLLKKVKASRGAYLFQAHLGGGGYLRGRALFNLEGTMISVLFEELERKVEKLKNKKGKLSGVLWRQGGKGKKSLQQHLWNLNIRIKKADEKC